MKEATFILLEAKSGKEKELENFLIGGAKIVEETEPKTLFWTALKLNDSTFAIFDTFTDKSGREEHFSGKVAAALKEQAEILVKGGWEQGVISNIKNFEIIAKCAQ